MRIEIDLTEEEVRWLTLALAMVRAHITQGDLRQQLQQVVYEQVRDLAWWAEEELACRLNSEPKH